MPILFNSNLGVSQPHLYQRIRDGYTEIGWTLDKLYREAIHMVHNQ